VRDGLGYGVLSHCIVNHRGVCVMIPFIVVCGWLTIIVIACIVSDVQTRCANTGRIRHD
jgi:hypothetical protein